MCRADQASVEGSAHRGRSTGLQEVRHLHQAWQRRSLIHGTDPMFGFVRVSKLRARVS